MNATKHKVIGLLAGAAMALVANQALAKKNNTTIDQRGQPVFDARGNCVLTKWQGGTTCDTVSGEVRVPVRYLKDDSRFLRQEELVIYFDFNSARITAESARKLDQVSEIFANSRTVEAVSIVGYTDSIGTEEYNKRLSQQRAQAVKDYLSRKGTLRSEITSLRALGETTANADCDKAASRKEKIDCKWRDRRVEIELKLFR